MIMFLTESLTGLTANTMSPLAPYPFTAQSKLLGEQNIQNSCDNWVIVRVSWLYGEGGKNFVSTMLKAARSGLPEIKVVNDQIGNPTSTVSAAAAIERLLETDFRGIVHATCEGEASWFDFAQEIFRAAGINQKVVPVHYRRISSPSAQTTKFETREPSSSRAAASSDVGLAKRT